MGWEAPNRDPIVAVIDSANEFPFSSQVVPGQSFAVGEHRHGQNVAEIMHRLTDGHVKLMPLNILGSSLTGSEQAFADAFQYAKDHHADMAISAALISQQWGEPGYDQPGQLNTLRQAIEDFGRLFVCVTGQVPLLDLDRETRYPPEYNLPNQITVAGTDQQDTIFTSYGRTKVHLAAPGKDIEMWTGGTDSGASYAMPQVAALAATLIRLNPSLIDDVPALRTQVLSYVDDLGLQVSTSGRLNCWYPERDRPEPPEPPAPEGNAWRIQRSRNQRVIYDHIVDGWPEFTVAAWVKFNSLGNNTHNVASQWNFGRNRREWLLARVRSNGRLHFEVNGTNVQAMEPSVGTRYLLVGRYGNGAMQLDVNGQSFSQMASGNVPNHGVPLIVGDQEDTGSNNLDGVVGGVAIWDKALTDPEAAELLLGRNKLAEVAPTNRVFYDPYEDQPPHGQIVNGPLESVEF